MATAATTPDPNGCGVPYSLREVVGSPGPQKLNNDE